jgi:sugar transferase (PEP-CTERM/EpsH1 system associated)
MNSQNAAQHEPCVIAHIVFRFDYGGLENGLVNVINNMSDSKFRHVVIALTESTEFRKRLKEGIEVYSLGKRPGKDILAYWRLFRLLRRIRPQMVHTRNIGTLDCVIVATLAGVPIRIHGEHGWDVTDPDGTRRKYRWLRQVLFRLVDRVVAVSRDLEQWLVDVVGVRPGKISQIYNGVDTERFSPVPRNGSGNRTLVVGSVTRFATIKDPMNLVEAFVRLKREESCLDLLMIGDGPLAEDAKALLEDVAIDSRASLPGYRDDIPSLLREMDVFVLGSSREGISNTILEAMATGLPVIATDTGGNKELVQDQVNGILVPPGDRAALADAIRQYLLTPSRVVEHGQASRSLAVSHYSIQAMIARYDRLYGDLASAGGV